MKNKKNIYIGAGCYSIYYILDFLNKSNRKDWKIYLFEPSPRNIKKIKKEINKINNLDIKLYEVAVFDQNIKKKLYEGKWRSQSPTLLLEKYRYVNYENFSEVECIDFNEWIVNNLNKEDYVYMDMDIEGAEYYVLPHLIKNGTINYFDELKIEFHCKKFIGENREKFYKVHKELKEFFINSKFDITLFQHF